jgi:hypothetical protein
MRCWESYVEAGDEEVRGRIAVPLVWWIWRGKVPMIHGDVCRIRH